MLTPPNSFKIENRFPHTVTVKFGNDKAYFIPPGMVMSVSVACPASYHEFLVVLTDILHQVHRRQEPSQ